MAAETELERMVVRLQGDATGYQRMLNQSVSGTQAAAKQIQSAFAGLAFPLATFAVGADIWWFIKSSVSQAAEMETMTIQFETMLQSATRGQQLMQDLVTLASQTPLTLPDVTRGSRLLLQFGVEGDKVIDTLRMLGDATGGDAQRLQSMAMAFGQMSAAGRLMGQDLLQMINAGFNPLQEISRTTGRSMQRLKKDMEDGKITVAMVTKAFESATGPGGRFHGMMERMSQTTAGLFSTMKDDIGAFMRSFGANIIEMFSLKDVMRAISAGAQDAVKWLQALDPATKTMAFNWVVAAGAVAGLGVALYVIGAIISMALSPLTMTLALATYLAKQFIDQSGGVSEAWGIVRDAGIAAWEWLKPIVDSVFAFGRQVWQTIVTTFGTMWDFVKQVWAGIAGEGNVTWATIRDAIISVVAGITDFIRENQNLINGLVFVGGSIWLVTAAFGALKIAAIASWAVLKAHPFMAIIVAIVSVISHFIEWKTVIDAVAFAFQNFGLLVQLVWANIKLSARIAVDFIRDAFAFLGGTLAGIFASIEAIALAIWNNIVVGIKTLINNVIPTLLAPINSILRRLGLYEIVVNLIGDVGQTQNVANAAATAYTNAFNERIQAFGGGDMREQNRLRAERDALQAQVDRAWNDFRTRDQMGFFGNAIAQASAIHDQAVAASQLMANLVMGGNIAGPIQDAVPPSKKLADNFEKAAKNADKLKDFASFKSAEALTRIADYAGRFAFKADPNEATPFWDNVIGHADEMARIAQMVQNNALGGGGDFPDPGAGGADFGGNDVVNPLLERAAELARPRDLFEQAVREQAARDQQMIDLLAQVAAAVAGGGVLVPANLGGDF